MIKTKDKAVLSDEAFPLVIDIKKTFPLKRIKQLEVTIPGVSYGNTIKLDRAQARYLYEALKEIFGADDEVVADPTQAGVIEVGS